MGMIDLLLKYSARDEECKALGVAASSGNELVMSKLLALKANQDPETGVNKAGINDVVNGGGHGVGTGGGGSSLPGLGAAVGSLAYSSVFPSTSVMINWHQQVLQAIFLDTWHSQPQKFLLSLFLSEFLNSITERQF